MKESNTEGQSGSERSVLKLMKHRDLREKVRVWPNCDVTMATSSDLILRCLI